MELESALLGEIQLALVALFGEQPYPQAQIEKTKPIFQGDYTLVVFPYLKISQQNPENTAEIIGQYLQNHSALVSEYNVIKGFLNIVVNPNVWMQFHQDQWNHSPFAPFPSGGNKIMVEYSSPNTNKPLHLGHIRNNLLGYSLAKILKAGGNDVVMANLVNDRGIHICKSMLAWQRYGQNETPESSGLKGDHLVGKYYVIFESALKEQTAPELQSAIEGTFIATNEVTQTRYRAILEQLNAATDEKSQAKAQDALKELVRNDSELMRSCQQMLRDWESENSEVRHLWETMNQWVYTGFNATYKRLGVAFDAYYYESNTYKLGKDLVQEGLRTGVFYQKEDGSVWIDLSDAGLDQKLVQRSDGTSVYITQDMGTADLKYEDHQIQKSIYVVGNEQDYHFKVLFLIMSRLGRSYAPGMYHASYGMVDLPTGKMKSREGTVVDADDLLQDMVDTAKAKTQELGKTDGLSESELQELYERLALAALKFFILKVDPKKRMLFNPEESIDFQGDTGPFVLYSYARIKSMLRQAPSGWELPVSDIHLHAAEIDNLKQLKAYRETLIKANAEYSPAVVCHYALDLAKSFNRFYNELPILKETDTHKRNFRLQLCQFNAQVMQHALGLLGIETVEKM